MRWSDDLGAKKGDLERGHQSELEGSGTRLERSTRRERPCGARGFIITLKDDLGARVSDLGRGHSKDLARCERVLARE